MDKKNIIKICIAASIFLILAILLFNNRKELSFYQTDDYIEEGNEKFNEKKYDKANIKYAGALFTDSTSIGALYNNANTNYRQEKFKLADSTLKKASVACMKENAPFEEKQLISKIYHNKGNAGMKGMPSIREMYGSDSTKFIPDTALAGMEKEKAEEIRKNLLSLNRNSRSEVISELLKQIKQPIKDYKDALRRDPENDSTRFNLALAQEYERRLLEELQNSPQSSQNNDQNQQDQKQDEQKKDEEQQKEEQKKDEQNQEQQNPNQMSKENAEQILKALEEEEKENMKKRKIDKSEQSPRNIDKDW